MDMHTYGSSQYIFYDSENKPLIRNGLIYVTIIIIGSENFKNSMEYH